MARVFDAMSMSDWTDFDADYYDRLVSVRTNIEQKGLYNEDDLTGYNPSYNFESRKVWESYAMKDDYAVEEDDDRHKEDPVGELRSIAGEEEDDVKVSLNVNDGTLTDKPIEHTDEHHTISDKDSTSPDDEGFSVGNIGSGNYERIIGYSPEPNHELGSHHLKSKKGERNSHDTPAGETKTFYSNIIGKLSGLESEEDE